MSLLYTSTDSCHLDLPRSNGDTAGARVCVWEVCNVYIDRVYEHSDVFLQRQRLKRAFNWGCSSDKQTARHRWTLKSSYKSKSTKVKADYLSTNKQSCIFLSHNGPVRKVYSSLASSWGQTPRGWADAGGGLAYTCFAICPFPVLTNALKSDHLSNAVAVSAVDKAADCPSRMQGRAGWMKAPLLTPRCQRGIIDDPDWTQQLKSGGAFSLGNLCPFGSKVATESNQIMRTG